MSRICQLLGKKPSSGNNRPFSLKATKRVFRPNLFVKKVYNPLTGKVERMKLSAKAIRTLKKWAKENGQDVTYSAPVQSAPHTGKHVKKDKLTPKQKKELAAVEEANAKNVASVETIGKSEEKDA